MLNKEFSKKDIQRMRNLATGNSDSKTSDIIGSKKEEIVYNEGDVWEENNKEWTIKNGIKQNITKLDKVKELNKMPLFCPECNKPMKSRNDKVFYPIHKKCFECVVIFEAELKRTGEWKEYHKKIHNQEIDARIEEFNNMLDEAINEGKGTFVTEDGKIEKWDGGINVEKVEEYRKNGVEYFNSLKK